MIEASGLEARVIQHEMDHLDGVLILDRRRASSARRRCAILREGARPGDAREAEPAECRRQRLDDPVPVRTRLSSAARTSRSRC